MNPPTISENSAAAIIARFLKARGIDRVFGLCGGHIMPIWMRIDGEGIPVVDVRDERAAVHMAHAHAEITGRMGVALVTAGPGVTNAINALKDDGLIDTRRGGITILDRKALEEKSNGTYVPPEG